MCGGAGGARMRCSYSKCERPDESGRFVKIEGGRTSGGQDWSSLVGSVLCQACYSRYYERGRLEKILQMGKPLVGSARRCTYDHCDKPTKSSKFYQIGEGKAAGGQDWSSVVGSVLCMACYGRFRTRGTLDRAPDHGEELVGRSRRCTYDHCHNPTKSSKFYQIGEGSIAGGQDWSSLVGSVLCTACYGRFRRRGTLDRAPDHDEELVGSARRCTYDHCDNPTNSSKFYQIREGKTAGGQDWSSLVGHVLCKSCYERFRKRGNLESGQNGSCQDDTAAASCDKKEHSPTFAQVAAAKSQKTCPSRHSQGNQPPTSAQGLGDTAASYGRQIKFETEPSPTLDHGAGAKSQNTSPLSRCNQPLTPAQDLGDTGASYGGKIKVKIEPPEPPTLHQGPVAKRQKTSPSRHCPRGNKPPTVALAQSDTRATPTRMVDFWDDDDEDGFEKALMQGECRQQ